MAAVTTTMMMEPRYLLSRVWILIDMNYCPLIIFQTFLVSGGYLYWYLSSTELLVGTASAWVFTGELPSPRVSLRGANIENRILMTGNWGILIS